MSTSPTRTQRTGSRVPRRLVRGLLRSRLVGALAYPHGVDRYLELLSPLALTDGVRAEVTRVHHQTPKSVTLTLRPNGNWCGLRSGQFVGVSVVVDGVRLTRPYSPAGPEQSSLEELELTVSTHPEGRLSRHLRRCAREGMVVDLTQASGEFTLPDPRPARVLLISGGSGITPVMAHLRTLCEERFEGEIGFLNYARSPELALYGRELARIAARHPNVHVARAYTTGACGPTDACAPLTGRFCREHLAEVLSTRADAATFVCGPPTLIDAVARVWAEEELRAPTVETFTAPAISLDAGAAGGVIRFERSGREVESSGLPLLEQAEDAGLLPEHGCRMGICNTCSTRKRAGAVRNVITGEISRDGEEDIRICVSAPAGDVALDL